MTTPRQHTSPGVRRSAWRAVGATALLALALAVSISGLALADDDTRRSPAAGASGDASDTVDVKADSLDVDTEARTAVFSGNVVLRRGDWVLACPKLTASYSGSGVLSSAVATGPVELAGPDARVEAGSAHYDRAAESIVLEGEPKVRRGQSVLQATKVTVHIETGKIDLEKVRGRFQLPRREPGTESESEKDGGRNRADESSGGSETTSTDTDVEK